MSTSEYSFYVTHSAYGAGSNVVVNVPREPGLCLMTQPGSVGGMAWMQPPTVRVETREVVSVATASTTVVEASVLASVPSSEVLPPTDASHTMVMDMSDAFCESFATSVADWSIRPQVTMCRLGRMVMVQISTMVVTLRGRNFGSAIVLPAAMNTTHVVVSAHAGDMRTSGLAAVTANGTLRFWPEMMRNLDAWEASAIVAVDGFTVCYIAAE